jgi:hypothetical protein
MSARRYTAERTGSSVWVWAAAVIIIASLAFAGYTYMTNLSNQDDPATQGNPTTQDTTTSDETQNDSTPSTGGDCTYGPTDPCNLEDPYNKGTDGPPKTTE